MKAFTRYCYVHALLLLMTILVAGSFPVAAAMMQELSRSGQPMGASELMLLRFTLAALLFAPYVFYRFGLRLPSTERLCVYTALALPLVVFFCCMFVSLERGNMLNSGALFTLVPALAAMFARLINGESSSGLINVGLLLGTVGALWIVFRGDWQAASSLQLSDADLVFLLGCLFLSVYQPLVKRWHADEPVAVMTFWVIVMAALLLLLYSVLTAVDVGAASRFSWRAWLALPASIYWGTLYLTLFTTLLSFFLQQLGALTLGPARTSAYSLLVPTFVMTLSLWLEPQTFSWMLLPGVVLVVLGVALIQWRAEC